MARSIRTRTRAEGDCVGSRPTGRGTPPGKPSRRGSWPLRVRMVLLIVAASTVVAGAVAGCGGSSDSSNDGGDSTRDVTMSINTPVIQPGLLNFWIGEYLGYNRQEGLSVEVQTAAGVTAALQRLVSGDIDVTQSSLEALFSAASNGKRLPVQWYYQYQLSSIYSFAVLPDSPIQDTADLAGKRIAIYSFADTGYMYAQAMLKAAGVDPESVEFVVLGQAPGLLDALKSGDVDAVSVFSGQYDIWDTQGFDTKQIVPADDYIASLGNYGLVARDDQLTDAANREMLVGYARAVAKATIFAIANPDAACRINFEMYPETVTAGRSYADNLRACTYIIKRRLVTENPEESGRDRWGEMRPEEVKAYGDYIGLSEGVDASTLFTDDLLDDINMDIDEDAIDAQAEGFCSDDKNADLCAK